MEGYSSELYPMSAKRKKILDNAFAQLRKSRAAMDPGVLKKIRRMIASSPDVMKALGLNEALSPVQEAPQKPVKAAEAPEKKKMAAKYEKVDPAKTMEIMARLMTLNPDAKDKVKSAIKKAAQ